jgi:hypothetical protein
MFQWVYEYFLEIICKRQRALWFCGHVHFAAPVSVPLVGRELSLCVAKYLSLL